jgi:hypothetical protein
MTLLEVDGIRKRRALALDGVRYEICVLRKGLTYESRWTCHKCRAQGAYSLEGASLKQANHVAETGLRFHHAFLHRRTSPRKAFSI